MLPTAQRQIGILFQDALLFDQFSVGQNLLLALPSTLKGTARRNAVKDALDRAGLEELPSGSRDIIRRSASAGGPAARPSPNQKRYSRMSHLHVLMWFARGFSPGSPEEVQVL